jgi:hypothetical protein
VSYFGPPSMPGARHSLLLCMGSYCVCTFPFSYAVDDSSVVESGAPLWPLCFDVQQLRAACLLRYLMPATHCGSACALIAHASHFIMAVDVSSFFCGSAAPRRYCSVVQQRRAWGLFLCSVPATRCCCAGAVPAREPLVVISCRYQPRLLFQRA